jgi:hypothetical protein
MESGLQRAYNWGVVAVCLAIVLVNLIFSRA